jgi:hypothetical protein
VGNITTLITVGAIDQQRIALQALGRWVYALSTAQKQAFARLIVGKSSAQAKSILKSQMGIADGSITLNGEQNDQLPDDVAQIDVQTK